MLGGVTMREIDSVAVRAKENKQTLETFIHDHEHFILRSASKVTHRYITKSDDEWSIALIAFTQAVDDYELNKGSFLTFAKLVIKRRLIDYFRSQGKFQKEISVDSNTFDGELGDDEDKDLSIKLAVTEKVYDLESNDVKNSCKYEIETVSKIFASYNFTFYDLSLCSPKSKKTKKACAKVINFILDNPVLINELRSTKQLAIKLIEKNTKVPRKTIERHRKYIILAVEIKNDIAIVLSDDGSFNQIPNNNYIIGQEIHMKKTKSKFAKKLATIAGTAAAIGIIFIGF